METGFSRLGFVSRYVLPALLLFAVPSLGLWFSRHAQRGWDAQFLRSVHDAIAADASVAPERRVEIESFYAANPPSFLCAGDADARAALPPEFVESACGDYAQLRWIGLTSLGSIALGVLSLVVIMLCATLAFSSRRTQYLSVLTGWHFLRATSLIQVLAQGFVAVMLSFWMTAYFFERYYLKLILALGALAVIGAFAVIKAIVQRLNDDLRVDGEALSRASSPTLWKRIDAICERLGTRPPDHIVGGIDDNFFVTEHPVDVPSGQLTGRTLFVSLALLKRLERSEADAVLTHEMAHFSGGDTQHSKLLAPLLARYATYLDALYSNALSRPIFYFMLFYRSVLELALGRSSRERELRADRLAAETTSPKDMALALIKVAAYSSYRSRVEERLFEGNKAHADLAISQRVALGFTDYAMGPRLTDDLHASRFPHPFDSHPQLEQRISNVGARVDPSDIPAAVTAAVSDSWFSEIGDADQIEQRLWKAYEERFKAVHDATLAYRYLPSNADERAHVERYFPKVELRSKQGELLAELDCAQIKHVSWDQPLAWVDISEARVNDALLGKELKLVANLDLTTVKREIALRHFGDSDGALATIERYYGRALAAKAHASEARPTEPA